MTLFMKLDCPHCISVGSIFEVVSVSGRPSISRGKSSGQFPKLDAVGKCCSCEKLVIAYFEDVSSPGGLRLTDKTEGSLTGAFFVQGLAGQADFVGQVPSMPEPDVPQDLPDNVHRAFLEAEKAFTAGFWTLAASGYGKAVDRAVSLVLKDPPRRAMLGEKIGLLEKEGDLPGAMLDWIRVVKDDRNFALHEDDQDFDKREDVEPAREFARTLVVYLFTMPEMVRRARGIQPSERLSAKSETQGGTE